MQKNRTTISRGKHRGVTERETVYQILDEGLICHISFIRDNYPVCLPVNYAREKDQIIVHGSPESPFFKAIAEAENVCLAVTLLDGLVLGKSAFNHSVNYRSVVIFGKAAEVKDPTAKMQKLKVLIDQFVKSRWGSVRLPTQKELDSTMVLTLPIVEYSAKMRTGDPMVIASDENVPVWSGVIPIGLQAGQPQSDKFSQSIMPASEIGSYDRKNYGAQ